MTKIVETQATRARVEAAWAVGGYCGWAVGGYCGWAGGGCGAEPGLRDRATWDYAVGGCPGGG